MVNPLMFIDYYKADHRRQYPVGTEFVYSNFTPRKSRVEGVDGIVFFGLQYFIKEYLIEQWNKGFFQQPKDEVLKFYKRRMDTSLGKDAVPVDHIASLHELGYLPIRIKAVKEGTIVPIGVAPMTIINTKSEHFWLTNYLETLLSNVLWKPCTSATTALQYKKEFERHADLTGYDKAFMQWQGHDFSCRGMSGMEDAMMSGAGHLLSFTGTDTVSAIDFLEKYYGADCEKELIGGSVPATEHSCMSMGTFEDEIGTFKRLITELYPQGIVSIVSDTWDFWAVITNYMPALKKEIMARNGRTVLRPDSGNPVKIICGDSDSDIPHVRKGAYECLWETFGGTKTKQGYKCLDGHIGLIYGDSITMARQKEILERLEAKQFSASNLVLGIGSYTYEYVTRDTYGFAMKATWGQVNGESREIFKDPKTDEGFKKSAKGLLCVYESNGKILMRDQVDPATEKTGLLEIVFEDGKLVRETTLSEIRNHLSNQLKKSI